MTPGPSRLPEGSIVAYLPERERGGQVSGRECLVQNPKPAYALVAKANSVRSGRISTCFSLPNDLQKLDDHNPVSICEPPQHHLCHSHLDTSESLFLWSLFHIHTTRIVASGDRAFLVAVHRLAQSVLGF